MGSLRGKCEITEVNDKPSSTTRPQTFRQSRVQIRDPKPPVVKKGSNKTLEDNINKLFEAVNLRSSKSLDLSDVRRNASKKPMKGPGSHYPGIGFSEPASLKQALRGLCISQAAEMAAMKRLSLPASPRISEAGKISNMYRSVVVETGESSCLSAESGRRIEISLVPEENASCADEILPPLLQDSAIKLHRRLQDSTVLNQSARASPLKPAAVVKEDAESKKVHYKTMPISQVEGDCSSLKTVDRAAPKVRPKSRLQTVSSSASVVKKSNKDVSTRRNTSRAVKPVVKNKNLVRKRPNKVAIHSDANSKGSHEVNSSQAHKPEKLICQRCQCSLKDTSKDTSSNPFDTACVRVFTDCIASKLVSVPTDCGFSSNTTSLSDESNLSCNNKPHMSNDVRWEAINHIRQKFGFLGLNHFNLLKKLGSGDIGTVYLAEMIGMDCLFAIKVMDNEFLAKRKKLPRAQTEKEILRMLDHPFLPTLYAQFTSDNLSCLVMEFCPGGDLHVLRQKQPGRYFPEQAARFYVAEVLLALEYLHMLGIVYRDLKPENILVREDGHIMLTDFDLSLRCSTNPTLVKSSSLAVEPPRISGPCAGSNCIDPFCTGPSCRVSCFSPRIIPNKARARKLKADARLLPRLVAEPTEARSNSFVGTHEYLAPEIIKGEGHGSAVDWWTFGVFLYELLYGKTPFKGSENEETLTNVVLQNLKFPDSPIVSFQARDFIRRLLVKEPGNRLGTETGAAEIKRHPFFDGLNWALIRCAVPPKTPEVFEDGNPQLLSDETGKRFLDYGPNGDHLEFELF